MAHTGNRDGINTPSKDEENGDSINTPSKDLNQQQVKALNENLNQKS